MERHPDPPPIASVMQRVDAVADGAPPPDSVTTGFPSLDKILGGGLRRGDLVVVGGDVASGKSALALAVALRAAQVEQATALYTGEMSVERVLERALAIEGRARIDDLRRGTLPEETRAGVGAAAVRLRDHAPLVQRIPAGRVDALGDAVRGAGELELVVVDSLQALARGRWPLDEELAAAMQRLKGLAVELDVALLVTAQLPRLERDRKDLRPQLADFGALGAVAQHADVILALFREEMYQPQGPGVEGATELLVLKNRNGATGYVDLYFYTQWMRFEDMLDPDR
ncbi:MAG TPA: DnaB-like helicase C-terminal domain-containing protein [Gemmatimonadaceae bacterium]|nr:DnaB-like helicase C-terminal domain-containing protein [Gemmatimonadaceae bacterium]